MNKPVALSDLDDTLFQTRRKMVGELAQQPFRTAALDKDLHPRSFMSEEQSMLVDWLLEHAELIPVTARGTEEISRVNIPFRSWSITTHGAVILAPDGTPDQEWQAIMLRNLAPYRERLLSMQRSITRMMEVRNINAWARLNVEYDNTPIYLVIKHRDSTRLDELYSLADDLAQIFSTEDFTSTVMAITSPGCLNLLRKGWPSPGCWTNSERSAAFSQSSALATASAIIGL